ncbi:MAG: tRNA pseudouridine(55) synthase TruB [Pseudobdellovibrionaceae bacterium]
MATTQTTKTVIQGPSKNKVLFHGLLLVNKATGMTSHDVVGKARRILGTKTVGHCGTLDPMASGLMVLLVNEATKLSQYILEKDKAYLAEAHFGVTSDTLDSTGKILAQNQVTFSESEYLETIKRMGCVLQLPVPHFSAVKIDGKKMYEYAREDKTIEQPVRSMSFYDIEPLSFSVTEEGAKARFRLKCSKGSYIRSFIHELGQRLGSGAVMSDLTREGSTPYRLEDAMTLEEVQSHLELGKSSADHSAFVPMPLTLPQFKHIRIKGQDRVLLTNGQISYDLKRQLIGLYQPGAPQPGAPQLAGPPEFGVKALDTEDQLVALLGLEKEKGFVIRRVFRY